MARFRDIKTLQKFALHEAESDECRTDWTCRSGNDGDLIGDAVPGKFQDVSVP